MNAIALQRTVADMVAEYEAKQAAVADMAADFHGAVRRVEMACSIGGAYGGSVFGRGAPSVSERDMQAILLKSAWGAVYDRLQIDRLATAKDKALWKRTIENPPPLTLDNAKATFGDYIMRSRFHVLRGLAEVFTRLDPAYKSHAKVKIGVKGLPKRIIITNVGSWGSYGYDKLRDVLNALAAFRGQPLVDSAEMRRIDDLSRGFESKAGEVVFDGSPVKVYRDGKDQDFTPPNRGVTVRKFHNGNAHVIFDPETLLDINRALAEFYGEVLPDAEDDNPAKQASTAVAKDLQFYPTPPAVVSALLNSVGLDDRSRGYGTIPPALRILEPSCGDGRIMDAIRTFGHKGLGIEVHAGRASEARAKGHAVLTGNFLEAVPSPDFDVVMMNPPFSGRHYLKHITHALKFLKPGGTLVSVLPATAWYDHDDFKGAHWDDLPVASFADSGTNVPTGILRIVAPC